MISFVRLCAIICCVASAIYVILCTYCEFDTIDGKLLALRNAAQRVGIGAVIGAGSRAGIGAGRPAVIGADIGAAVSLLTYGSRAFTLHTSHPLVPAVTEFNRLLECVAAASAGEGHGAVRACMGCGANMTCSWQPPPLFAANLTASTPPHARYKRVALGSQAMNRKTYLAIIRPEPSLVDVVLSWQPFNNSHWQEHWPFRNRQYYPARQWGRHCTCVLNSTHIDTAYANGHNDSAVFYEVSREELDGLAGLEKECQENLHVLEHPQSVPYDLLAEAPTELFVHIIRNGTINKQGNVKVGNMHIVPYQCQSKDARIDGPVSGKIYQAVFVATQYHSREYYHSNIENLPRLLPYLEFLRNNPHIKIHVSARAIARNLWMLGLDGKRFVQGVVRADVIYLPQGGGCVKAHPITVRMTHQYYQLYIHKHLYARDMAPARNFLSPTENGPWKRHPVPHAEERASSIILIQRSKRRFLMQHTQVVFLLQQIARARHLRLEVFSDKPLPPFRETVAMFARAKLVVAPHGAGLTNLLFSPPGTRVVEIIDRFYLVPCYRYLHSSLGQPYVGLLSTRATKRGQIYVNLAYLKLVVLSLLDH